MKKDFQVSLSLLQCVLKKFRSSQSLVQPFVLEVEFSSYQCFLSFFDLFLGYPFHYEDFTIPTLNSLV